MDRYSVGIFGVGNAVASKFCKKAPGSLDSQLQVIDEDKHIYQMLGCPWRATSGGFSGRPPVGDPLRPLSSSNIGRFCRFCRFVLFGMLMVLNGLGKHHFMKQPLPMSVNSSVNMGCEDGLKSGKVTCDSVEDGYSTIFFDRSSVKQNMLEPITEYFVFGTSQTNYFLLKCFC